MTIDPRVELAHWRAIAMDTLSRGHWKLAQEIWGQTLNEYEESVGAPATSRGRTERTDTLEQPTAQLSLQNTRT